MRHIVIVYHGNCNDGLCSAAIAAKFLSKEGTRLHFVAAKYGTPAVPEIVSIAMELVRIDEEISKVFILDFCPRILEVCTLNDLSIPSVIIDHHKSAKEVMEKEYISIETVYSEEKSGALLTWEYFAHKDTPPDVVACVSDRDLFKFELEKTRAFHAGVMANYNRNDLGFWHALLDEESWKFLDICILGEVILNYQQALFKTMLESNGKVVKPVIKYPNEEEIGGINVKVINHIGMYHGFCDPSLVSDFSDYVKKELGVHLVCLYRLDPDNGGYIYSVRSGDSPNQVTARAIAEYFGGGGHDKAAGFDSTTLLTS